MDDFGFIREEDLVGIIAKDRLQPLLIRCDSGRFSCPAQDAKHFIDIITEHGGDYVRDVSLLKR